MPKPLISLKDRYEFFKPKIHVESETLDKQEIITALFIRGLNRKIYSKIKNKVFLILKVGK
jgi:hypothetical protein